MPKQGPSCVRRFPAFRSPSKLIETLERREMLSVSLDANGFTVVTPNAGDRVIYCSSSTGDDANSGLSSANPVATLKRAESLTRDGFGDQLLLKAGDSWQGSFVFWRHSGASPSDPTVLGSYGVGPRPLILSGSGSAFVAGAVSSQEVDNLDILGIHFMADARNPALTSKPADTDPTGISILTHSSNILVENCQTDFYGVGMNFQDFYGPLSNITVRRNIIDNSWATKAHSQGVYALGVDGLTFDGNVFDHNGWNTSIHGADPTFFNHDCYISAENSNVVVENNLFASAAGYGLQDRPGGIVKNNVFVDDPVAMSYGLVNGARTTPGGVTGEVTGNVFLGGTPRGPITQTEDLLIGNIRPGDGAVVSQNIFSQAPGAAWTAIELSHGSGQADPQDSVGLNDLTIESNIFYQQANGIYVDSGQKAGGTGLNALNRLKILNNQFEFMSLSDVQNSVTTYAAQENISGNSSYKTNRHMVNVTNDVGSTMMSSPMDFLDPSRNLSTYNASLGNAASLTDLLTRELGQSQQTYTAALAPSAIAAYVQAGFGLSLSLTPPGSQTPPPVTQPPQLIYLYAQNASYLQGDVVLNPHVGLGNLGSGDYAGYRAVDFGTAGDFSSLSIWLNAPAKLGGGSIQICLDSPTGPTIGTLSVKPTAGVNPVIESTSIKKVTGVHNVYLIFTGKTGFMQMRWMQFA